MGGPHGEVFAWLTKVCLVKVDVNHRGFNAFMAEHLLACGMPLVLWYSIVPFQWRSVWKLILNSSGFCNFRDLLDMKPCQAFWRGMVSKGKGSDGEGVHGLSGLCFSNFDF